MDAGLYTYCKIFSLKVNEVCVCVHYKLFIHILKYLNVMYCDVINFIYNVSQMLVVHPLHAKRKLIQAEQSLFIVYISVFKKNIYQPSTKLC